jgi:maltooligosyltrehalose synthase
MPREQLARELLAAWPDGRIKLYLLATLLRHRAATPWPERGYTPLQAVGTHASHVVAFARGDALVVVPRLPRTLAGETPPTGEVWADPVLPAPQRAGELRYREVLTGRIVSANDGDGARVVRLADALAVLPVAVLEPA